MDNLERLKETAKIVVEIEKTFSISEVIICSGKKETFCKIVFMDYFTAREEIEILVEECLQNVKSYQFFDEIILTFCIR